MATYTVNRAKHATLVALIVDTVNFNRDAATLVVTNRGTSADIFVRLDGTAPVINGDDNYVVPPGQTRDFGPANTEVPQIKLISAGLPAYSVEL